MNTTTTECPASSTRICSPLPHCYGDVRQATASVVPDELLTVAIYDIEHTLAAVEDGVQNRGFAFQVGIPIFIHDASVPQVVYQASNA